MDQSREKLPYKPPASAEGETVKGSENSERQTEMEASWGLAQNIAEKMVSTEGRFADEGQARLLAEVELLDPEFREAALQEGREMLAAIAEKISQKTRRFKEALYFYTKIVVLGASISFAPNERVMTAPPESETWEQMVARAQKEIERDGITWEQKGAYVPVVSPALYDGVRPWGYRDQAKIKNILSSLMRNRSGNLEFSEEEYGREDAWRLYLGLPQLNSTFGVSRFKPKNSADHMYYYRLNGLSNSFDVTSAKRIRSIVNSIGNPELAPIGDTLYYVDRYMDIDSFGAGMGVMGEFMWSKGEDETGYYISYYDKWDLAIANHGIGKTFEIYDRIYYDPQTFEPLNPRPRPGLSDLEPEVKK